MIFKSLNSKGKFIKDVKSQTKTLTTQRLIFLTSDLKKNGNHQRQCHKEDNCENIDMQTGYRYVVYDNQ